MHDIRQLTRLHEYTIEINMLISKVISDIARRQNKTYINIGKITNEVFRELQAMQNEMIEEEGLII